MHLYFSVLSCKLLQSIWTINFINHHKINGWDLMLMLLAMPMLDHIALSIIDNQGALSLMMLAVGCCFVFTCVNTCVPQYITAYDSRVKLKCLAWVFVFSK